jgi:hypothetical protein
MPCDFSPDNDSENACSVRQARVESHCKGAKYFYCSDLANLILLTFVLPETQESYYICMQCGYVYGQGSTICRKM